jgi:hypothetical protein
MKKNLWYKSVLFPIALTTFLADVQIASGQDQKEQPYPIPETINNIFKTSCMPCHWADGKKMAMSRINFSKWAEYDSKKEAKKASLICKTLGKGKMPPKSVRESAPELIPTKEQIDLICGWAESLKSK